MMIICPNPSCQREADAADAFCPHCAQALPRTEPVKPDVERLKSISSSGTRDKLLDRVRRATANRFDILGLLGRGGMAAVYLARDLKLGREVALKVMLPQFELTEGMAERFALEARTAARLSHRNIIIVHDVEELDDLLFFVMQRVDGASLEQVVSRLLAMSAEVGGRLPIPPIQSALHQVAVGLEYAHAARVVHRDMKPNNVMITVQGDVIITDFGIAKVMADVTSVKSSALMGTPTYMSPEQCKGWQVSGASDQYSLGVMAYELLVGQPPFFGNMYEVQHAHVHEEPRSLLSRRAETPPALAAAVMKMLSKRDVDRFASMSEVVRALEQGYNPADPEPRRILGAAALAARDGVTVGQDNKVPPTPILSHHSLVVPIVPDPRPQHIHIGWNTRRVGLSLIVAALLGTGYLGFSRVRHAPELSVEPLFGQAAREAVAASGLTFSGPHIAVDFSAAGAGQNENVKGGRLLPPPGGVFRNTATWQVPSGDFALHFDIRYESGVTTTGGALYLGAMGTSGSAKPFYLLFMQAANKGGYALVETIGQGRQTIVPQTATKLLTQGTNRIDVLVQAGAMHIFINDVLVTTTSTLPATPDGRFGFYVSPNERYSFNNIVASQLTIKGA